MNFGKKLFLLGALAYTANLEGFFDGDSKLIIELTNGYRYDHIDETWEDIDIDFISPSASSESIFKSLQSYQLGAKGLLEACNLVGKGSAYFAGIIDGDYNRDHMIRAEIDGHAAEWLLGLGYDVCFLGCLSIIPCTGYSYDSHHLNLKKFDSFDTVNFPPFTSHAKKQINWYGPWIGIDLAFRGCGLNFDAGYEFHFGTAQAKWKETDSGSVTFSSRTKIKQMYGHVFHIDTLYKVLDCWTLGLNLAYTYWGNSHKARTRFGGLLLSSFTATQSEKVFDLRWYSFSTSLALGAAF